MQLPPSALPWNWGPWWENLMRLGAEMGADFNCGLWRASGSERHLDLRGKLRHAAPVAKLATWRLMQYAASVDLSENGLTCEGADAIAEAVASPEADVSMLKLAKNSIKLHRQRSFSAGAASNQGIRLLDVLAKGQNGSKLVSCDLRQNPLCDQAKASLKDVRCAKLLARSSVSKLQKAQTWA